MAKYKNIVDLAAALKPEILSRSKEALAEGAQLIVDEAKSNCPVGNPAKDPNSGRLRDSIHQETVGTGMVILIKTDAKKKGYPYARIVEYDPVKGHPFLYPALDAKSDEVKKKILTAMGEAADNV